LGNNFESLINGYPSVIMVWSSGMQGGRAIVSKFA